MAKRGVLQVPGRFALALSAMTGWRQLCLAFGAGVIASLALPPLYWVFLLWPAFAVFFWLLDGCGRFRAALVGWFFGFGFSVAGIYWVGSSFLVDAEKFAVLMPFAVAGLAAVMALFTAGVTYLTALSGLTRLQRIFFFTAAWLFADWVRSWLFTGFPWNFLGTVWGFSDAMLQLAALGGVWALTLVTVLAAAVPSLLRDAASKPLTTGAWVLIPQMLLLAVWAGGELRLSAAPALGESVVEGQRFRIVQPAIAQKEKWIRNLRLEHVKTQMNMTLWEGYSEITQVVWAETAVPFLLSDSEDLRRSIARIVPPGGYLFTGAPRVEGEGEAREFYNSLHALDSFGEIRATFDKFHLVPFGEYDPLSEYLPLGKLVVAAGDFDSGSGPQHWTLNGLPAVSPLICYEVIFPGAVVASDAPRPGWILNVTNDAWFGETAGPHQHFVNVRLRAVEEGLPVIRAANTGISAVVDSYGRVVEKLALGERGVVDADLPAALNDITPYAKIGNAIVGVLIAGLLLLALLFRLFLNQK